MSIELLYFAAVRESTGKAGEQVDLDELGDAPTVGALWSWLGARYEAAKRWKPVVRVAVNQEFVGDAHPLCDGDEVALIPPVSGGSGREEADNTQQRHVERDGRYVITRESLDPRAVEELMHRLDAGAVVTFQGTVRDHTGERLVERLEYEAYEQMALAKLVETGDEAEAKWPGVLAAVHHRHGVLTLGEVAVVVCVSSPHRKAAFEACAFIIDRLKEVVPIWKKEVSPDGTEWVGWGP
jgi:molybdopterin synthase catalytic subunit